VVFDTISRYYTGVNSVNKTPLVIGHRGNPTQAPENTIEGFLTADKNGATLVELDIYLTKDGEVIILHDPTLKRTTNCRDELANVPVASLTLEQIRRYRLLNADGSLSDQPVPTLGEVFEALKDGDLHFLIELKSGDIRLMEAMCAVVQKHNMQHRVNVLGASSQSLCALPDTQPFLSGASLGGTISDRIDLYQNAHTLIGGAQNNYSVLNCALGYTTRELIRVFNDRGIAFHPWGMSASNAFRFYYTFLWGADGLSTDDVQFTKDNPRLFTMDKVGAHTLKGGQTLKVAANVTTYAGQVTNVGKDAEVVWLTNPLDSSFDPATGTFKAGQQSGTVSFMLRYTSPLVRVSGLDLLPEELAELENYTLYTQPVTVTVKGSAAATTTNTSEQTSTVSTSTPSDSAAAQPTTETTGTLSTSTSTEAGFATDGSAAGEADGSADANPHLGLWIALAAVFGSGAIGVTVVLLLRKKTHS
jgi:glycerophosphoryl diester phosphodiesterase